MKKTLLTFALLVCGLFATAQDDLYLTIKKLISSRYPDLNLENRLIAYNLWSVNDAESRETNKAFEKTVSVYEYAKLKGGLKGLVVISFNKENLSSEAVIVYTKDGIKKVISFKLSELPELPATPTNCVYDSNGNLVYKNLSSPNVFSSFQHLITR